MAAKKKAKAAPKKAAAPKAKQAEKKLEARNALTAAEKGWKDTVLVMPGERVRILTQFNIPGLFVFHCHNLEHEDDGMMLNYAVA